MSLDFELTHPIPLVQPVLMHGVMEVHADAPPARRAFSPYFLYFTESRAREVKVDLHDYYRQNPKHPHSGDTLYYFRCLIPAHQAIAFDMFFALRSGIDNWRERHPEPDQEDEAAIEVRDRRYDKEEDRLIDEIVQKMCALYGDDLDKEKLWDDFWELRGEERLLEIKMMPLSQEIVSLTSHQEAITN